MKKIVYAFCMGMMLVGVYCLVCGLMESIPNDPELAFAFMGSMFVIGFIFGHIDYSRKMKKKEEEKERQAEQDRTNELMREYLEKKLREEEENGE